MVIDGCPARVAIHLEDVQRELDRRRPGQSCLVTQRKEADRVAILSGVEDGYSTGTPIAMLVMNEDARSRDYDELKEKYRPSHADFTYDAKYGTRSVLGGGRASARETIGRVAAGAVAKEILKGLGVEVLAWVSQVQSVYSQVDANTVAMADIEATLVRCPDPIAAEQMIRLIETVRKDGDSVGGVVSAVARGVPAGWGEPVFDKLEADLAKAVMSLPACKGFEVGSGFGGALLRGSEHNDPFFAEGGRARTRSNRSGGIQGGISNGENVEIRAAFKPTATIMHEQETITRDLGATTLKGRGRHDACVLPRAVPMVEAMIALVFVDHALRQEAQALRALNRNQLNS